MVSGQVQSGEKIVLDPEEVKDYFSNNDKLDQTVSQQVAEVGWQFVQELAKSKGVELVPLE